MSDRKAGEAGRRLPNPFRPGFNQAPELLAGRDDVLAAAREALEVAALDRRCPRPLVLTGSRGVGKTVLLGEVASIAAEEHGWLTVHVEVRPNTPFIGQLVERLIAARELLEAAPPERRFEVKDFTAKLSAFGVGGELGVHRRPTAVQPVLPVEVALAATCAAAADRESGLVMTVDELQLAHRREIAELAAVLQQHVPDNWPLVVVLAGLPGIRDKYRSVTYLERGEWHELGLLDRHDTLLALEEPARAAGRPFDADAASLLAEVSGGYPFAVQLVGHHAWRASTGTSVISIDAARRAVRPAEAELAAGLYAGRWEDAGPAEREYLATVAALEGDDVDVTGPAVAARLGRSTGELSYLRDRIIKKGTLVAVGRVLRFPVPGMAEWIREQGVI